MNVSDWVTLGSAGVAFGGLIGTVVGYLARGIREDKNREQSYIIRKEFEDFKSYAERKFEQWEALWVSRE